MMGIIRQTMPLVARQAGVWDGQYVHFDPAHREVDRHRSRLVCRLFDGPEGEARLTQSNIYSWADGTREIRYFEAEFSGDRLWIRNELINGWTAQISLDPSGRTLMVAWVRVGDPDYRFYELITLSRDGNRKNRTWHGYRDGELFRRTLINEMRVAHDWREHDQEAYRRFHPRAPVAAC